MNILEIAVFNTIKELSVLSYISHDDVEVGDLVYINLNKRQTKGLVLSTSSIKENKTLKEKIRGGNFELKKINSIISKNFIDKDFIKYLSYISSIYCLHITKVIEKLLPKISLEILQNITSKKQEYPDDEIVNNNLNKQNNNVLIFTPTIIENQKLTSEFEKYFKENDLKIQVINFNSEISESKKLKIIENINSNKINNTLLIFTPSFLPLAIKNISHVLWVDSDSKYYENWYGINTQNVLTFMIENYYNIRQTFLSQYKTIDYIKNNFGKILVNEEANTDELYSNKPDGLNNNKEENIKIKCIGNAEGDFIFGENIKNIIKQKIKQKENIIFYTTKSSDFPTCICNSCKEILTCDICKRPLSLHIKEKKNKNTEQIEESRFYYCKDCNIKTNIKSLTQENTKDVNKVSHEEFDKCKKCNSFEIVSLGISTKQIYNKLKQINWQKEFDIKDFENQVYIIDDNNISIKKRIDIYNNFKKENSHSNILVINESGSQFLENEDNIFVISLDTLLYIKNYEKDRYILETILNLQTKLGNNKNLYLQTRVKENKGIENIIDKIEKYNLNQILIKDDNERNKKMLPPYSYIITFDLISIFANIPNVLKDYKNYIIKTKNNNTFVYKYIFIIPKAIWEENTELRNFINNNFLGSNLKVNEFKI